MDGGSHARLSSIGFALGSLTRSLSARRPLVGLPLGGGSKSGFARSRRGSPRAVHARAWTDNGLAKILLACLRPRPDYRSPSSQLPGHPALDLIRCSRCKQHAWLEHINVVASSLVDHARSRSLPRGEEPSSLRQRASSSDTACAERNVKAPRDRLFGPAISFGPAHIKPKGI